ncbi:MAG: glutaminyl-peptide cyclotransferase [Acidobacteria bacterium]|nr:glutaminyl-peptide cyclotransferase [Acidobacteriota bacterium]
MNATGNTNPTPQGGTPEKSGKVPSYGYEVVDRWPHDPKAFTQGLVFHEGLLIESAGQYGESTLRRVEPKTGRVLEKVDLPAMYFAEGLTIYDGKIYQLTWQHHKGFIYDLKSFKKLGEFRYDGEGWGLTHDAESLILSDGTNQIRFIDPKTFEVRRTISVREGGQPLREINELEYVKGEIYANVWHKDSIARIDPQTGNIVGWIDLKGLLAPGEVDDEEAVLNGIAYDEGGDRLFVTGKLWPMLFEIRLKEK